MSNSLTNSAYWEALEKHFGEIKNTTIKTLFEKDKNRGTSLLVKDLGIYFDFAKHRITDETLELLFKLAESRGLERKREAMFSGEKINTTENRAVLHTALRAPKDSKILVDACFNSALNI
ncbi:MAG: hypothetical protein CVU43_24595 [Chloroflexi bacterium HGW-Chloroflexi-5]|nr:MAG: hypothetical protein CVU43_24595 [Chloroflexi bacterium HGW-Chloroflexi-5]